MHSNSVGERMSDTCGYKNISSFLDFIKKLFNTGFWFLGFGLLCRHTASNPITTRCIQVVCSNKEAQKHLTESNGTPVMDLGPMNVVLKEYYFYVLFHDCCFEVDIRIRRYTNKRLTEQNKHEQEQIYFKL